MVQVLKKHCATSWASHDKVEQISAHNNIVMTNEGQMAFFFCDSQKRMLLHRRGQLIFSINQRSIIFSHVAVYMIQDRAGSEMAFLNF
jgi:hypothetical protein